MRTLFIIFKQNLLCLLLSCLSINAIAQQEEQAPSNEEIMEKTNTSPVVEEKSESKNTDTPNSNEISIPPPISLTQQFKDDLAHYLPTNNVKPLSAGSDDYITLITENTSVNNKGIAILLPDWQQGATNPKAINFLRKNLPLHGWTTISIQPMNKPENYPSNAIEVDTQRQENQKIIDEYKVKLVTMLNAVINTANDYPGIIMIIAQGNHGAMIVDLLHQTDEQQRLTQEPNALILLSSYVLTNKKLIDEANTNFAKKLASSEYPVLDLYLKKDNHIVLYKAKQRLLLSKKEMKVYYRQRQLNSSEMGYYPETELLTQVNSWLRSIGW